MKTNNCSKNNLGSCIRKSGRSANSQKQINSLHSKRGGIKL